MSYNVHCIIMGGGRGDRLFPLTKSRCKPAVPLAGKYRLIDVPISNCLNSGLTKIYILTQFNTRSLHRHIESTYRFDIFGKQSIEILSAEQDHTNGSEWYAGTADAVRKNLKYIDPKDDDVVLILSGDQLYRMDLSNLISDHIESGADVTISAKVITGQKVSSFGIMSVDEHLRINEFVEKPKREELIKHCAVPDNVRSSIKGNGSSPYYLASMGIYVFSGKVLRDVLGRPGNDFGKNILPMMLSEKYCMHGYIFDGFWEDIGTVRSFFDTNIMLASSNSEFDLFDAQNPIYTRATFLPACKMADCQINDVLFSEGCIATGATLNRCVLGPMSVVGNGVELENVIMFGADSFDSNQDCRASDRTPFGIGKNSVIKNAIIDKNVRIGRDVHLSPFNKPDGYDCGGIYVKDGILCISRGVEIRDGTVV